MKEVKTESQVVSCNGNGTRNWYAWIDKMPPPPDAFHMMGEVLVSNPGIDPILVAREPQGFNPNIFQLDLFLLQKPGIWPEVLGWKPVRYDQVGNTSYTSVEVFCEGVVIATIPVQIVS